MQITIKCGECDEIMWKDNKDSGFYACPKCKRMYKVEIVIARHSTGSKTFVVDMPGIKECE